MTGQGNRWRDLAGWLGASAVSAALFGGAAAAALRMPPVVPGDGPVAAVALDLSVGVVPLSAVVPSESPAVAPFDPPDILAPQIDEAPALADMRAELPEPVAVPQPDLPVPDSPTLNVPQADVPPMMAAVPPPQEALPALVSSPRPEARPARQLERQAEAVSDAPKPEIRTDVQPKPPPSEQVAAPAQAAGSDQAARPAQKRQVAGGQVAARYGDQVMRQIARLRRHKAPERGVVTVGFEIGRDGGLRQVSVVSSSGSAALDRVAMDHIRRAAPFPPPPEGAAVRFAFEFVGR